MNSMRRSKIFFKFVREKSDNVEDLESELEGLPRRQMNRLFRETDERGNSALHYAAKAGNLGICKFLYNKEDKAQSESVKQFVARSDSEDEGANLVAKGQNKMTPLQFAARYGDKGREEEVWECMKWIMEECERKKDKEHSWG